MSTFEMQPSFDRLDNRPDTSGIVPPVHWNPGFGGMGAGDPFTRSLANILSLGRASHPLDPNSGWGGAFGGAARSYDPRTLSGVANLVSTFLPAGRMGGFAHRTAATMGTFNRAPLLSADQSPTQAFVNHLVNR
jgi:hypothetical protein